MCLKSSADGGQTWSSISYPFGRNFTSAQPNIVYDRATGVVIIQNRANGKTGGTNMQVESRDNGRTWSPPAVQLVRMIRKR